MNIAEYKLIVVYIFLFGCQNLASQTPQFSIGGWHFQSFNSQVGFNGEYRSQKTVLRSGIPEYPKTSLFNGRLRADSRGYIWHPNFLQLQFNGEYHPGVKQENFLNIPDRAEAKTAEKFEVRSIFFSQRPLSLSLFTNYNHNFVNREFTTDVEMFRNNYGARLSYRNSLIPVVFNYSRNEWQQREIQTGRAFLDNRHSFKAEGTLSLTSQDDHHIGYTFDDFSRDHASNGLIENEISAVNLRDVIFLDKKQQSQYSSTVWYQNQTGNQTFKRLQINENLNLKLPKNFGFNGSYQFTDFEQAVFNYRQHSATSRLEHRLFLSLTSQIYLEYSSLDQSAFDETMKVGGFSFDYQKKIPIGRLNIFYEYRLRDEERQSAPQRLRVVDEPQTLTDTRAVLLNNPFVIPESIVVTDATGIVIYQENIDYILIPRGNFLEIQRIPGGQILEGSEVYVDYLAAQAASYNFEAVNHTFGTRVFLHRQLVELYYQYFEQDYQNIEGRDLSVLKFIDQNIYGSRISYGMLSLGVELDHFNSNIVPYRSSRYFLSVTGRLFKGINFTLNGNHRNYKLTQNGEKQQFSDIFGRLNYPIHYQLQLKIEGSYRFQQGRGIDLDLASLKAEVNTQYRQTRAAVGLQIYRRDFTREIINFTRVYLRIERSF